MEADAMKTIREVIAVLNDEIEYPCYLDRALTLHRSACLRRARQIVKASQRRSAKKKGKR